MSHKYLDIINFQEEFSRYYLEHVLQACEEVCKEKFDILSYLSITLIMEITYMNYMYEYALPECIWLIRLHNNNVLIVNITIRDNKTVNNSQWNTRHQ